MLGAFGPSSPTEMCVRRPIAAASPGSIAWRYACVGSGGAAAQKRNTSARPDARAARGARFRCPRVENFSLPTDEVHARSDEVP